MKKIRLLSLAALGIASLGGLAACGGRKASDLKVGLILLHAPSQSTYDANFKEAFDAAQAKLGFTALVRDNVAEDASCTTAADELADLGCDIIIADSFDHEGFLKASAVKHPDIQYCHATGVNAASYGLSNFHNAFASIYEGRYLAGVAAGLRMQDDIAANKYTADQAKVGYIGAKTYAEVKSGYTSFFLGVRSIVPTATMDVTFTDSWWDYDAEKAAANTLIAGGAKLISQHADSYGAPKACEDAGIPNVSYNGSTADQCPETFLVSSKIDWQPYYEHVVDCVVNGKDIETDFVGTLADGSVKLTDFGKNVPEAHKTKVAEEKAKLVAGTLHVFDVNTFKVNGQAPSEANCAPDKQYNFNYPDGTEFLKGGYYNESVYRSAPSFDVNIDGITLLNGQ